jgi:hypothetical protein
MIKLTSECESDSLLQKAASLLVNAHPRAASRLGPRRRHHQPHRPRRRPPSPPASSSRSCSFCSASCSRPPRSRSPPSGTPASTAAPRRGHAPVEASFPASSSCRLFSWRGCWPAARRTCPPARRPPPTAGAGVRRECSCCLQQAMRPSSRPARTRGFETCESVIKKTGLERMMR